MANYNKSFNFRNGVQVDQDNFLVDSLGRVGIGTSIARTDLDVYGNVAISGKLDTYNSISSGIATFNGTVKIGTGITMDAASGIISAKYYGDGSNLSNLPTSQWISIDPISAYTSIYSNKGNVGIATTNPRFTFQIGGNPSNTNGLGISSEGNVKTSGIITANSFSGSGADITSISAANISSGTFSANLFSNINSSGIATIQTLGVTGILTARNLSVSGIATIGFATFRDVHVSGAATIATLNATTATISSLTITQDISFQTFQVTDLEVSNNTNLLGITTIGTLGVTGTSTARNLQVTGITTVGFITAANLYVSGIATIRTTRGDYLNVGIGTITSFTSSYSQIGISTATTFKSTDIEATGVTTSPKIFSGNVQISNTANTIDSSSGDLKLDAFTKKVSVENDLYVTRGTYLAGISTVALGLVPDVDVDAYLGQSTKAFSEAYIDGVRIGVGGTTTIDTRGGDLELNAFTDKVKVANDFYVTRGTYLAGISTVALGLVPDVDVDAYLGQSDKSFSEAYIDGVRIGVGGSTIIDTRGGDLRLDAFTKKVSVENDLYVTRGTYLAGISTVALGLVPDIDTGAYLGQSTNSFSEAYVDGVRIGVGGTTTIDTRGGDLTLNASTGKVSVSNDLYVTRNTILSGIATVETGLVPNINSTGAYLGQSDKSFSEAYIDGVRIGVGGTTTIDTRGGDLKLTAPATQKVNVLSDLRVDLNTYLAGISTVETGLVPDADVDAYLGQSTKAFSEAYIDGVRIGVGGTTTIDTRGNDLKLDASTGKVNVVNDFKVDRNTYLVGITTVEIGFVPNTDTGTYLGQSTKAFSEAYIDGVQIGVGGTTTIDTRGGDLKLTAAATQKVNVLSDLRVDLNTYLTGIATVQTGLVPDADVDAYLGQSNKAFTNAYVSGVQLGVGSTTTIDTRGGDLRLDAFTKKVNVVNDLEVTRNLSVTGVSTFTNLINVALGLVPDADVDAYLGQSTKAFSEAYIDGVRIGVSGTTIIDTRGGDLRLDAFTKKVSVENDLYVTRGTYLAGISTVETGLVPNTDTGAYLGQSTKAFSGAYIDGVQIGVSGTTTIDTRGGDLILDSSTNNVKVNNNLLLPEKLYAGSNYNTLYVDGLTNKVGIGTSAPTKDFEFKRQNEAEFAIISNTNAAKLTVSSGNTSSYFKINPTTYELGIINDYPANVSNYIHAGAAGINTGNFNWVYGQNNNILMSLTYGGKLGIAITNPINTFHVVGTTTVTSNSYVGNNLYVANDIYFNGLRGIINTNANITSGVSTFSTLYMYGGQNVLGIGTDSAGTYKFKIHDGLDAYLGTKAILGTQNSADTTYFANNLSAEASLLKVFGGLYVRNLFTNSWSPTSLAIGAGNTYINVSSGIVTASRGFSSGIGTAVQITTVGNRVYFTVAGVGVTSLQLF
jgi:hypothetical protein